METNPVKNFILYVIRGVVFSLIILILFPLSILAQVELVRSDHPVYEFLKRMQVRGILAEPYTSSALPYDRIFVAQLLRSLNDERDELTQAEHRYLDRFVTEFSYELDFPQDVRQSIFHEGISWVLTDRQKYLFRYEDTTFVFSANLFFRGEPQIWRVEDQSSLGTSLWQFGGGLSGTFGGWFGFSLHATNGYVGGSREMGLQNIEVRRTYKITEPDSRFFDETHGHIRIRNNWGAVTVGRERLIYGLGPQRGNLILSDYAPAIDYVGIDLRYKWFSYSFFHGWLVGNEIIEFDPVSGYDRIIPEKYMAFHRIGTTFLDNRLNLAFSEIIVYGNRGVEISYLNPFLFFASVEHSLRDRDKALIGLEIQTRPFAGLELYGELLIDDLAFNKLGTRWWGNQYAFRLGGMITPYALVKNSLVQLDYVRIQPYVYTHRLPRNAYTHNGFPLGNNIGPNSDAWSMIFTQLFSEKIIGEVYFQRIRKGYNEVNEDGDLIRNVGGDVSQGWRIGDSESVWFLDGKLEKINVVGIYIRYEFFRQFYFSGGFEYRIREETWLDKTFYENKMFAKIEILL